MCIQQYNENIDEFVSSEYTIFITTINSPSNEVATMCIQEELCQRKFIETFRCNVKSEIGDHLLFRAGHSNQAFSKARTFEGEF